MLNIMLSLLDSNFKVIGIVDEYSSLIWADRYDEFGDFELYVSPTEENVIRFQKGYYLTLEASDHFMIIESVEIISDIEQGDKLQIQGRSFESILFRRIVWSQTLLSGNLQTEIQRLLNENIISPIVPERDISGLSFVFSVDPIITALTINGQYWGEYIYDVISSICKTNSIGFKIIMSDFGVFQFKLYAGVDRSYDQFTNPYVVFSPNFDNLLQSDYFTSDILLKTAALITGEGEGTDKLTTTCYDVSGGGSGLSRREIYVDASDLSKTTDGGTLTDPEYLDQLEQRGQEILSENKVINHFEGEIESNVLFIYGTHFFMGDVVQILNNYGNGGRSRVTEFIFSDNLSGSNLYPTFNGLD